MTLTRRGALIIAFAATLSACQSKEDKAKAVAEALATRSQQFQSRLAKADASKSDNEPVALWLMPVELREISGLALTPDGRLLTHDDEIGKVYELDPRHGLIEKSFMLGQGLRGDFEAITVAGQDIYLLLSKGILYKFREGANGAHVPYTVHDLKLGKECEFEGVVYEKDSSWLVLPCKKVHTKHLQDELVIYRWKIGTSDSTGLSMLTVPLSEVIGSNKWKAFHPSDITIDPATGNYVIVASIEKGILVMTPGGEVLDSQPLPGRHHQAEGVAITNDSILIVSDEAGSKPAAVTLYRWKRSQHGEGSQ